MSHERVIIIGSGPAGHTAAIYSARANLTPLMLEGEFAGGVAAGGQLTTTTEVENFPGFPDGVMGPDLMDRMREQSIKCGTRILTETVDAIDISVKPFRVISSYQTYETDSIILATGATAKRMGIPGETQYWQNGISACAVCDGALPVFRNQPLVVVGGGDSAIEEATHLTKFTPTVTMLVRRGEFRASKAMQNRVAANPRIQVMWYTQPLEAIGNNTHLTGVTIHHSDTNIDETIPARGLFYAIGHTPNTAFLQNCIALDETGYIVTTPGTTTTSVPGVFACGDVQDKRWRQAITAAGSGCMAALEVEHYLSTH